MTAPSGAAPLNSALLEARQISKRFSGLQAVGGTNGLSFSVQRGAFVGLIGPNGAGKSTTFDLLSGVQASDTGSVLFEGREITRSGPHAIAEGGIGRTFQTPRAFESLTVLHNVVAGATSPGEQLRRTLGSSWRRHEAETVEAAEAILWRVGLSERAGDRVGSLSSGELRMLEVARQLVRDPTMLPSRRADRRCASRAAGTARRTFAGPAPGRDDSRGRRAQPPFPAGPSRLRARARRR